MPIRVVICIRSVILKKIRNMQLQELLNVNVSQSKGVLTKNPMSITKPCNDDLEPKMISRKLVTGFPFGSVTAILHNDSTVASLYWHFTDKTFFDTVMIYDKKWMHQVHSTK